MLRLIALVLIMIPAAAFPLSAAQRTVIGDIKYPWLDSNKLQSVCLCAPGTSPAAFLVDEQEPFAVQRTLRDVISDLHDVTGWMFPVTNAVPVRSLHKTLIIAGTVGASRPLEALEKRRKITFRSLKGKRESFLLQTVFNPFPECEAALVIAGSDIRGTIYGLYSLTQDGLGIDPLRFWTENPVTRRDRLILGSMYHLEDSPRFKYRGWFINDEDQLQGWRATPGSIAAEIYEHILETMLRLRQNMIIPQTAFNLSKPNDRRVCEMVRNYGLLLTTHHAMPLGVWGSDWNIYWKSRGMGDVEFSYVKNKDKFGEIWQNGVDSYSPYMGIWQLGLRGKDDDAIWRYDTHFPKDPAGRGKLIRQAIDQQRQILREKFPNTEVPMTTTLWFEVLDLYNQGHLQLPEDIVIVISDWGRGAMYHLDSLGLKGPLPDGCGGVYYHIAFQDGFDSHLVQTVHPQRIAEAFDMIYKYNLTTYFLVNVANIREYVMGIRAVSDATWTGRFDADEFYHRWCSQQFGTQAATSVTSLYKKQFAIPHRWGDQEDLHFMVQGMVQYGLALLDAARRGDITRERFGHIGRWHGERSYEETLKWFVQHCGEDSAKWDKLWREMSGLQSSIPKERQQFYRDNVLLQCYTAHMCTRWLFEVCKGLEYYGKGDKKVAGDSVRRAAGYLKAILERQKLSQHGKWHGYYSYHGVVRFKQALNSAQEFLDAL